MKYILLACVFILAIQVEAKVRFSKVEACLDKVGYPQSADDIHYCNSLDKYNKENESCLNTLQLAYQETVKSGAKQIANDSGNSIFPSQVIMSTINKDLAWVDKDGQIRVSSEKGSVAVDGRSCESSSKLKSREVVERVYNFMKRYDEKSWKLAKESCNSFGIGLSIPAAKGTAGTQSPAR